VGCAIFVIVIIGMLIGNTYSIGDNIIIDEVNSIIKNKDDKIIYVLNNKSNNSYNKDILDYLSKNNISFSVYDISVADKEEYSNLLSILSINREFFDVPAIIYIKDGFMFANIININDMNIVDRFIKDYDLMTY
jgi:hypothetical protein